MDIGIWWLIPTTLASFGTLWTAINTHRTLNLQIKKHEDEKQLERIDAHVERKTAQLLGDKTKVGK